MKEIELTVGGDAAARGGGSDRAEEGVCGGFGFVFEFRLFVIVAVGGEVAEKP